MNNRLIIIRGLPGSGKSTLAKSFPFLHIESDMFMLSKDGKYAFDPTKLKENHELCLSLTKAALSSGATVVVSNTFTQNWEMKPYIEFAQSRKIDVRVINCTKDYGNVHNVPKEAIEKMRARWEDVSFNVEVIYK